MQNIQIRPVRMRESSALNTLFLGALKSDFSYFSSEYLQAARHENTKNKLMFASIHPKRLVLGAFSEKNEMVGFSFVGINPQKQAFLFWLFVAPKLRGQKLGAKLLNCSESILCQKAIAKLRLVTHNQEQFYTKHGYNTTSTVQEGAYGVPMKFMQKKLV